MLLQTLLNVLLIVSEVHAHRNHDLVAEKELRKRYLNGLQNKALEHCTAKLKSSGLEAKIVSRRQILARRLRKRDLHDHGDRFLQARDLPSVLAKSHSSKSNYSMSTPDWVIFGEKASVLSPKSPEGPYYVTGDSIRKDVRETQKGVPLHVDLQFIDMNTCEPVNRLAVDFWSCNSTGVYGNIRSTMNGNANDPTNLSNTMLRGVQFTNENGAAQFTSVFPGHYYGRTNHIHILSYVNATRHDNNTISGGNIAQVGQLYFDQTLIDEVEKLPPYNGNKEPKLTNVNDYLINTGAQNGFDPLMEYVLLGSRLEDGVFAWLNLGIDTKANHKVSPATKCSSSGCVVDPLGGLVGMIMNGLGGMFSGFGKGVPKGKGGGTTP